MACFLAQLLTCIGALGVVVAHGPSPCPAPPDEPEVSTKTGHKATFNVRNTVNVSIEINWVGFDGKETMIQKLESRGEAMQSSYTGHIFRFYTAEAPRILIYEYKVQSKEGDIMVKPCGNFGLADSSPRHKEYAELSYDYDVPCEPVNDSSKWGCIRRVDKEDIAARDPEKYGLPIAEDGKQNHDMVDMSYTRQIKDVPKVTPFGPGYMRMRFTKRLDEARKWWVEHSAKHGVGKQEFVPGGYTNSRTVELDISSLDLHRDVHQKITDEMRQILEWWTGMQLEHTATYGVRTYHRQSVLIDHVDRHDTHIASAVLQMSQSTDHDGGWPLEVMLPEGRVGEVYLQSGELVLYEGAWLRHGRPMQFRGDNFSNVFCHFRPRDWTKTGHLKGNRYYGVPNERFSTIADEGIKSSTQYGFLAPRPMEL